ncbi:MAG: hypothetical protein KAR47_01550, partial [Planctomycetes bacterium]|nr:hypothetical protein [Planctomycetota bacterium]
MQRSVCLTVIILLTLAAPLSAYSVLWDTSHGVGYGHEPAEKFAPLVQALQSNDFTVTVTRGGFLTDDPGGYDVIVVCVGSAWYSSYTSAEVDRITDFVNSGGGLLIMSDNTYCPNHYVQPVASAFGVTVGASGRIPGDLYLTEFADHPLFDGINRIYMRAAGEVSAVLPSKEVAWQNGTEIALVTVGAYGNGRVVALGENAFLGSYLHIEDNEQFSINVFQYLANPGDQCTAPDEPSEPEPVDGATGVPLDTLLSWNGYTSEPEQSLAASALAGVEVDDTGAMVGAQMAAYAQTAQTTSAKNILYFWEHSYTTLQRLEDLGYSVTQTTDPGDLTRANLQNYDLLWIDFAVSPLSYASQASDIQQWVSLDGGGLLVVQPGITGAQVTVFPGGFDVTIESQGWSFDRVDCAIVNHSHPIVQGLTDLDLSGNYDTV